MKEIFELDRMLMDGLPYSFLLEVLFRCVIMFIVAITVLRLAGRRGIKQLSIFELVIILTLGSAAGDPLFYEDVGLLPTISVFIFILILYRLTTFLISRFKKIEHWLECTATYLIEDGEFAIDKFEKGSLAQDEFFAELRLRNVTHIGQVDLAILETNGQISVFFFKDENVRPGLPVLPHHFNNTVSLFNIGKKYACKFCANICQVEVERTHLTCNRCGKDQWVLALDDFRVP
ncbi:MAG TPA: YetF domain-containing protein [Pelobium sp.]|nr:YetF domain-containing protein [Pelobium sp.]